MCAAVPDSANATSELGTWLGQVLDFISRAAILTLVSHHTMCSFCAKVQLLAAKSAAVRRTKCEYLVGYESTLRITSEGGRRNGTGLKKKFFG